MCYRPIMYAVTRRIITAAQHSLAAHREVSCRYGGCLREKNLGLMDLAYLALRQTTRQVYEACV